MRKTVGKIKLSMHDRMSVILLKGLLLLFLFCNSSRAQAQYTEDWYLKKVLDNSNGLLQNSVISMYFDKKKGFLWMTTEAGIVRYDGIEPFIFDKRMLPDMKTVRMSVFLRNTKQGVLAVERSGKLYTIEGSGVHEFKKDSIEKPTFLNGPFKGSFADIAMANEIINNLTDGARDSFGKYRLASSPLSIITLSERTWVSFSNTAFLVYNDRTLTDSFPKSENEIPVLIGSNNLIYALNDNGTGYLIDPFKKLFKKINCTDTAFLKGKPRFFYDQLNNQPLLLNGDKLYQLEFSGEKMKVNYLAVLKNLPNSINSIFVRPGDNLIFVGSQLNGLFIYAKSPFRTYKSEGDLHIVGRMNVARNNIYANVLPDSNHLLTSSSVLFDLSTGSYSFLPFINERAGTMMLDKDRVVWYAYGDTIMRFKYGGTGQSYKKIPISLNNDLPRKGHNFLKVIYKSSPGRIWISTKEYFGYIENDSIIPYVSFPVPEDISIDCIAETAGGELICGNSSGIYHLDTVNKKFAVFKQADIKGIRSVYIDDPRHCWITTYGNGIFMYDLVENKLHPFPADPKGYLLFSHTFCNDGSGNFLIPTNRGIFRINRDDLLHIADASAKNLFYQYFDINSGLQGNEFNGGCQPAYNKLPNGDILFPSLDGLVRVNVKELPNPQGYPIFINRVETRDSIYTGNNPYHFNARERSMTWYLSFAQWEQEYTPGLSYKLDNDGSWIYLQDGMRRIQLSDVSSGDHILYIRFRAGFSAQTISSLEIPFSIEKKYFEQVWFWIACLLFLLAVMYFTVRIQTKNLDKKNILLEKKVNEKTKELSEKNEELNEVLIDLRKSNYLKSSLISLLGHDIIVPLRYMGKVTRYLKEKYESISREKMLDNIGEINLTAIQLQLFGESIIHWIRVQNRQYKPIAEEFKPADIVKELEIFYLPFCVEKNNSLVSESVNDIACVQDPVLVRIIIHNLLLNANKFTSDGTIKVKAGVEKDRLLISISDTGRGMSKEKMDSLNRFTPVDSESGTDLEKGWGIGYTIIMDLLSFSKGTLHVESKPGEGTTVTVSLPAKI